MLTDCGCTLTPSLDEIVSPKSSGGASAGTLTLICQPGSVPRLIVEKAGETIWHGHVFRSFARLARQLVAEEEALTSAVNCRLAGLSNATMAGVANRGRQSASSLALTALAGIAATSKPVVKTSLKRCQPVWPKQAFDF